MLLSPEEFRDALTLHYQFKAQGDKRNCEGCGGSWGLQHALNCKKGGHVGRRHNEVNQVWCDLAELTFASAVGKGASSEGRGKGNGSIGPLWGLLSVGTLPVGKAEASNPRHKGG
uniref:Uncharacterized protein n=1 Tax=Chromera velia CCMP2878 TaxID=1169474 RepID=A0A0G4I823_9ALVE|eukprot:Cvel_11756.t1-p1 / transcript=Cvel_11756.t1 / gene=Cvel_11756 / organism=Chromera_velia_CCMP2878 / gene_product=hypothetical protein / transcript_product=hypothetical protein / location=Cvel_scaffold747:28022-28363(-) / protein_length=114 / sequence_SO=supercontig / SO=protein_coding / is_pseudo=false